MLAALLAFSCDPVRESDKPTESSASRSASRLVGTWKAAVSKVLSEARAKGIKVAPDVEKISMRFEFNDDDSFSFTRKIGAYEEILTGSWEAVDTGAKRIRLKLITTDAGKQQVMNGTVVFEDEDRCSIETIEGNIPPLTLERTNT